jgi:hypothetical protein
MVFYAGLNMILNCMPLLLDLRHLATSVCTDSGLLLSRISGIGVIKEGVVCRLGALHFFENKT